MGPVLEIDAANERFKGEHAAAANQLLSRQYRQPFVVVDQV